MGSNSDFERGRDAIYKQRDRNHLGYEAHEHRGDFDDGWDLGRKASDPNNSLGARDIVTEVRDNYGRRSPSGRTAYHEGFAAGASRTQKVDDE